jgi:hypothetical protein
LVARMGQAPSAREGDGAPEGANRVCPPVRRRRAVAKRARLPTLHRGIFRCGPRDRDTGAAPPIKAEVAGPYLRAPRVRALVPGGRNSRTARGQAYEACTQAPHPSPFSGRLARTPLVGRVIGIYTLLDVMSTLLRTTDPIRHQL